MPTVTGTWYSIICMRIICRRRILGWIMADDGFKNAKGCSFSGKSSVSAMIPAVQNFLLIA